MLLKKRGFEGSDVAFRFSVFTEAAKYGARSRTQVVCLKCMQSVYPAAFCLSIRHILPAQSCAQWNVNAETQDILFKRVHVHLKIN